MSSLEQLVQQQAKAIQTLQAEVTALKNRLPSTFQPGIWWLFLSSSFLACDDFGGWFRESFPACVFFLSFLLSFFLKWRSASAQQLHILRQDQSTVAQRAETTVYERALTSCV